MERSNALALPRLGMAVDRPLHTLLSVLLIGILTCTLLTTTACPISQTDLQKVEQIMQEVVVALPVALQLFMDFQAKVPANLQTQVQSWAQQGLTAAQLAQSLLAQYTAANAATTIQQVNAALAVVQNNLAQILTAVHVVDHDTELAISAGFAAIVGAVGAVGAAVSALLHKATASHVRQARVRVTLTAKTFRGQFNDACASAGHPELHI